jgi:hypothetical protein
MIIIITGIFYTIEYVHVYIILEYFNTLIWLFQRCAHNETSSFRSGEHSVWSRTYNCNTIAAKIVVFKEAFKRVLKIILDLLCF